MKQGILAKSSTFCNLYLLHGEEAHFSKSSLTKGANKMKCENQFHIPDFKNDSGQIFHKRLKHFEKISRIQIFDPGNVSSKIPKINGF